MRGKKNTKISNENTQRQVTPDFHKSLTSRYGRSRSSYKYNLFSSLDLPVNTLCGGCGEIELIATKSKLPWG